MKKIITIILVLGISLNTYSQAWTKVFSSDQVMVESTEVDCNPNNKEYPFSYLMLKFTNLTDSEVDFDFYTEIWYNGVKNEQVKNDASDEEIERHIHLQANESKQGDCNSNENFKIFYKNNHPKMDHRLTRIEIQQIKTK
tara:strand:+ start:7822 stop:8241 length:420 start_codon:yes stop_codon:yes gene_type:complete